MKSVRDDFRRLSQLAMLCLVIAGSFSRAEAQEATDPWAYVDVPGGWGGFAMFGAHEQVNCSGGARSVFPEYDIWLYVSLHVDGAMVNQNIAQGYQPNAQANTSVERLDRPRELRCEAQAWPVMAWSTGILLPDCGDERNDIIREYRQHGAAITPKCSDFVNSGGWSPFHFAILNTGDYSWGMIRNEILFSLTHDVEFTYKEILARWNYIHVSSGYRNPADNASAGGATNSRHIYGDAIDYRQATGSFSVEEPYLIQAAQFVNASWIGDDYAGHVHADWRNW